MGSIPVRVTTKSRPRMGMAFCVPHTSTSPGNAHALRVRAIAPPRPRRTPRLRDSGANPVRPAKSVHPGRDGFLLASYVNIARQRACVAGFVSLLRRVRAGRLACESTEQIPYVRQNRSIPIRGWLLAVCAVLIGGSCKSRSFSSRFGSSCNCAYRATVSRISACDTRFPFVSFCTEPPCFFICSGCDILRR